MLSRTQSTCSRWGPADACAVPSCVHGGCSTTVLSCCPALALPGHAVQLQGVMEMLDLDWGDLFVYSKWDRQYLQVRHK